MTEIHYYESEDGKRFKTSDACRFYEAMRSRALEDLKHSLHMFDLFFTPISIEEISSGRDLDDVVYVVCDTEEAIQYFNELTKKQLGYYPPFVGETSEGFFLIDPESGEWINFDDIYERYEEIGNILTSIQKCMGDTDSVVKQYRVTAE